jgi:hypothetical protein
VAADPPEGRDAARHTGAGLAAALAERMQPHLPAGITAHADGGSFYVRAADGSSGGIDVAWMLAANPRPWEELVEAVIERALNAAQDKIAETTGGPWPARDGPTPTPWARAEDDEVRLGYGGPDAPVLELAPVALAPLRQP